MSVKSHQIVTVPLSAWFLAVHGAASWAV